MLTKFGFKGKIQKRLIETATEDEFWELVKEEESVINEDADSQNENLNQNDFGTLSKLGEQTGMLAHIRLFSL